MSGPPYPTADLAAQCRYLTNPQSVTVTSSAAVTQATALTMGCYEVYTDQDVNFLQGGSTAATSASWLLLAYDVRDLYSSGESEDKWISMLAVNSTATVKIGKVS